MPRDTIETRVLVTRITLLLQSALCSVMSFAFFVTMSPTLQVIAKHQYHVKTQDDGENKAFIRYGYRWGD